MAKKVAPPAKAKAARKPSATPPREQKLLKELEGRSAAAVKGGARRRTY